MIPSMILGRELMSRFIEEADRGQSTLLPECLDDFIDEGNPVRVIDVFVDALDWRKWASMGWPRRRPDGRRTIPRFS
jgi:transposase